MTSPNCDVQSFPMHDSFLTARRSKYLTSEIANCVVAWVDRVKKEYIAITSQNCDVQSSQIHGNFFTARRGKCLTSEIANCAMPVYKVAWIDKVKQRRDVFAITSPNS